MKIGIDASNINVGGGVTHITQIINNLDLKYFQENQIYIWGNKKVLDKITNRKEIKKIALSSIYKNIIFRIIWQMFFFENQLKKYQPQLLCKIFYRLIVFL